MATILSPLRRSTDWVKLEEKLQIKSDSSLIELTSLSRDSFRHDLWQRQNIPSYNLDPYRGSAYTLYFLYNDLLNYVTSKTDIALTNKDLLFLNGVLYDSLCNRNPDDYYSRILSKMSSSETKLILEALMAGNSAILSNLHFRSPRVGDSSEMGISLMMLVSLGSMIEIVLDQVIRQLGDTPKPTLATKIDQIKDYETSDVQIIIYLFRWVKDHRNRIHTNVMNRSDSIKLNYDVTKLIYVMVLNLFIIILSEMRLPSKAIDYSTHFRRFDCHHTREGSLY
ncbi:hypothetical protein HYV12_01750 [Candidatus Dojkabacteria bacterium]|nr:hypothetical protein [Candidatus Dojkabacteria bacterium]